MSPLDRIIANVSLFDRIDADVLLFFLFLFFLDSKLWNMEKEAEISALISAGNLARFTTTMRGTVPWLLRRQSK
jgi:hypothetical protein